MDFSKPQAFRNCRRHPDYEDGVRQVKEKVKDKNALNYVLRSIEDWLFRNAHTCPSHSTSNLFLYKPDSIQLLGGDILVLFAFEEFHGEEIVMLYDITFSPPEPNED